MHGGKKTAEEDVVEEKTEKEDKRERETQGAPK